MTTVTKIGLVLAATAGVFSAACTAQSDAAASAAGETPEAALDSLDEQTEGTSYSGWTQNPYFYWQFCISSNAYFGATFTRTSGSSTRGGGACYVEGTGVSCTSNTWAGDQLCTCGATDCIDASKTPTSGSAQGVYGTNAWGYCYQSKCYYRPQSQAVGCDVNPNRSPGSFGKSVSGSILNNPYVLSCMTKAAGPSYACGVTPAVPNDYMRTAKLMTWDATGCY